MNNTPGVRKDRIAPAVKASIDWDRIYAIVGAVAVQPPDITLGQALRHALADAGREFADLAERVGENIEGLRGTNPREYGGK